MKRKILIILALLVVLAVVIPIVKAPPFETHDVEAFDQAVTPSSVEPGEMVTISFYVRNNGIFAEDFDCTIYCDSVIVGTVNVMGLAAGETWYIEEDVDTTGMPLDEYPITVWADSSEVIVEINESNNYCTAPASLFVVPEIPVIGAAGAMLAMFGALAIYMKRKSELTS